MQHLELFPSIQRAYLRQPTRDKSLICKQGFYTHCSVLKLQKAAWTNDPMTEARNHTGIFFSIWANEKIAATGRLPYNIHALKLRQLKNYSLTSIAFAKTFRDAFKPHEPAWPNVRTNFGPLTLMQGWIPIVPKSLKSDILALLNSFAALSPLIDTLLAKHPRPR